MVFAGVLPRSAIALALSACLQPALAKGKDPLPPFVVPQSLDIRHYGEDNDLLTAGIPWSDFEVDAKAPPVSDPPTRDELRKLTIWTNTKAIISVRKDQGFRTAYGVLGPAPGTEYMAYVAGATGPAATVLVQIPDRFDRTRPCIVSAPSSGSRGIYGAISTAEVAFRKGCAVASTDKGTGIGYHDLSAGVVYDMVGRARPLDEFQAGEQPHFRAPATDELRSFMDRYPNRIAIKHAHSGENVERDWGRFVLHSIEFAFWALNDRFADGAFNTGNVLVIAAGVSNGGGAALRAAEQDQTGLIDGIVVSEPQVQPTPRDDLAIIDRGQPQGRHSRSLYDLVTFLNIYADCAAASASAPANPAALRCAALASRGKLNAAGLAEQIEEAKALVRAHGILADADPLLPNHTVVLHLWRVLAPHYASAYRRASVEDHLCESSFAAFGGSGVIPWGMAPSGPGTPAGSARPRAFSVGSGLPGLAGIAVANDRDGVTTNELAATATLEQELRRLDAALCWRAQLDVTAVAQGIQEVRASGDLKGKPTLILHGRKDALIAPNHSSRAYFGLNQLVEGPRSRTRYIEIANGNHFDAFIGGPVFSGVDTPLVAMHGYFDQAIERMLDHLDRLGAEQHDLPASQVVLTETASCPLPLTPAPENRIGFENRAVVIPAGKSITCP